VQCRKVVLACREERSIPYFKAVRRGERHGDCVVVYAHPPECTCTPQTSISFTEYYEYREEELTSNVKVTKITSHGARVYVFPKKVWLEVKKLYIEPLARGEPPFSVGLLLFGPSGTGKSTLARIIAEILGVNYIRVTPDSVLSMYVGESEKALRRVLNEALASEPSVVIIDDAEFLLSARKLSEMREMGSVVLNLQNILFNAMQEAYDEGRRVLFVASSNLKPSEIDIAFRRVGRFGNPVFVPLPDFEALYEVLKQYLPDEAARELALKCVNMGLSIADAIGMAIRMQRGLEVDYRGEGRGYIRVHVDPVPGFEKVFNYFPVEVLHRRSRLYIRAHEDVAFAIAAQLALHAKRTIIRLVDIRYYDEAAYTANTLGSVVFASTSVPRDVLQFLNENLETCLILGGEAPPPIPAFPFLGVSTLKHVLGSAPLVDAVLRIKGLRVDEKLYRKMLSVASETSALEKLLETIVLLGYVNENLLSNLSYYVREHA
jgi:ATPases of the AAA+ class